MTPKERAERRRRAAQACVDRFANKPYEPGKRDCTMMARHCLHKLGLKVPFAKGIRYSTELGGAKALKAAGFTNLIDAVDSLGLQRIPPAAAQAGDLIALPTDHALGALAVSLGQGTLLAYGEEFEGATILGDIKQFVTDAKGPAAWRTLPVEIDLG